MTKFTCVVRLWPVIVQVPDDISGQRGPKKWVQLGQNCYQPADGQRECLDHTYQYKLHSHPSKSVM